MRLFVFTLAIVTIVCSGCGKSQRETRFLRERQAVIETVQTCFTRPYPGLERFMPKDAPTNLGFPGEDHILMSAHTSKGWYCDGQWEVIYHPRSGTNDTINRSDDISKLFYYYFGNIESSGFRSSQTGVAVTSINSMRAISKSWSNNDRSLLLTAHVVSEKQSGETIITVFLKEAIKH